MSEGMPYSYHTFIYPFFWKSKNESHEEVNICFKKLIDNELDVENKWEKINFNDLKNLAPSTEQALNYATYQYFMPKARKMIFDTDKNSISCYKYNSGNSECSMLFCFDKDSEIEEWHLLPVHQIRLEFLDKLNIGVLIFELENYGYTQDLKKKDCQNDILEKIYDDLLTTDALKNLNEPQRLLEITKINDLGRRVFSPYVFFSGKEITGGKDTNTISKDNHAESNVPYKKAGEAPLEVSLVIKRNDDKIKRMPLVDCRSINKLEFTQSPDKIEDFIFGKKTKIDLYPAIDDRMFVVCCMGANRISAFRKYKDGYIYSKSKDNRYTVEQSQLLYQLIFLEREKNLSCQNKEMLQQKLHDHIYARWIDYGTVHGATEYSLICITGCDDNGRLKEGLGPTVINPFLTEYTEMAKIALLQRAEIIKLEDEVSDVSESINPVKFDTKNESTSQDIDSMKKNIGEVRNIWRKYIIFQNELLLPEVTFQEQGVEIYDLLKKSFRIEKLSTYLDSDLNNLHDMAELEDGAIKRKSDEEEAQNDRKLSTAVNLFSVAGISLALVSAIQDAIGYAFSTDLPSKRSQLIFKIVAILIEFYLLFKLNMSLLKKLNPEDNKQKESGYYGVSVKQWKSIGAIIVIGMLVTLFLNFL